MGRKPQSKSPLTDAERHARFIETARAADASKDPKDFERAFGAVAKAPPKPQGGGGTPPS